MYKMPLPDPEELFLGPKRRFSELEDTESKQKLVLKKPKIQAGRVLSGLFLTRREIDCHPISPLWTEIYVNECIRKKEWKNAVLACEHAFNQLAPKIVLGEGSLEECLERSHAQIEHQFDILLAAYRGDSKVYYIEFAKKGHAIIEDLIRELLDPVSDFFQTIFELIRCGSRWAIARLLFRIEPCYGSPFLLDQKSVLNVENMLAVKLKESPTEPAYVFLDYKLKFFHSRININSSAMSFVQKDIHHFYDLFCLGGSNVTSFLKGANLNNAYGTFKLAGSLKIDYPKAVLDKILLLKLGMLQGELRDSLDELVAMAVEQIYAKHETADNVLPLRIGSYTAQELVSFLQAPTGDPKELRLRELIRETDIPSLLKLYCDEILKSPRNAEQQDPIISPHSPEYTLPIHQVDESNILSQNSGSQIIGELANAHLLELLREQIINPPPPTLEGIDSNDDIENSTSESPLLSNHFKI